MKKRTTTILGFVMLNLFFAVCSTVSCFAGDVPVPAGTNILQGKVNNAATNDVLILAAGNHFISTSVFINKKITLRGAGTGSTFIIKTNGATQDIAGIVVNAGGVNMNSFSLDGKLLGGPGLLIFSDNNILSNLIVKNCGNNSIRTGGIIFEGSNFNTISSVKSNNNRMVGLSQNKSSGNSFTGCTANDNGAEGLTIDLGSDNCRVSGCTFINNNVNNGGVGGIGIDSVNGAWVKNSTISGTKNGKSGITFQNNKGGEDGCIITGNSIKNNTGHGILVRNCIKKRFTNNTLEPNSYSGNALMPNVKLECALAAATVSFAQKTNELEMDKTVENANTVAYPNPAVNYTCIDYNSDTNKQINFVIKNAIGAVVESKSVQVTKGIMRIKIDVTKFYNGIYFLSFTERDSQKPVKFIVSH